MINLRYHIVSITAVFLALGIGLTLGSSFLDRVTVDNLKHRLDTVQQRVEAAESRNDQLTGRVGALEERDAALAEQLPERLLSGHLDGVPVLVVATRGTDEDLINATIGALSAASSQVAGTWWLTERWMLEDPDDLTSLADLLGLTSRNPDRLRRNAAIRIAELLANASKLSATQVDPTTGQPVPRTEPPPPPEPALIAALAGAGFLDYQAPSGATEGRALLPGAAARYVVVSEQPSAAGAETFASALLDEMVSAEMAPVVAAQGAVDLPKGATAASDEDRPTTFVGPLR